MALLQNFGPQSIRQKLRLGTLFLAIILMSGLSTIFLPHCVQS